MAAEPSVDEVAGTNIKIIDPNPTNENINHEDLIIYVNLKARTKGRSILTEQPDETVDIDQQFVNVGNKTNFTYPTNPDGSFQPLNTNWTKIGGGTLDTGEDVGGFGITNINIDFKSSFMPQIVIDFVDIRGATLFEQGPCSPYAAFFHLPYPVFELTVKGFYGKPVKYTLALVKFNTKFNSETGNFESKAEFVGYTYAFLADIPMGYVMAASYMPEGKTILEKKYKATLRKLKQEDASSSRDSAGLVTLDNTERIDGVLTFVDSDGIPTGLPEICGSGEQKDDNTTCGPITIRDLIQKVKELEKLSGIISQSKEMTEITNLNKLSGQIKNLTNIVNNSINELVGVGFDVKPSSNISINTQFAGQARTSRSKMELKVPRFFTPNNVEVNPPKQSSETPKIVKAKEIIKKYYGTDEDSYLKSKLQTQINSVNALATENNLESNKIEILQTKISNNIKGLGYGTTPDKPATEDIDVYSIDLGAAALGEISTAIQEIEKIIDEKKESIKQKVNKIVFEKLGFKPTIRNIFAIILCNVEVFLETLIKASGAAESSHEDNDDVGVFASDVTRNILGLSDNPSKNANGKSNEKIYPWPTYYELKRNKDGSEAEKETYPGVQTQFFNWEEVKYVEKFITAFGDLNDDLAVLSGQLNDRPGFDNFIPLTPFETHAFGDESASNRWYRSGDFENEDKILEVMGESAFLIGDYSFLNKLTAWKSQLGFDNSWSKSNGPTDFTAAVPQPLQPNLGRGVKKAPESKELSWGSPWVPGAQGKDKKLTVMTNLDLMNKAGKVDALNFLTTSTNSTIINAITAKFNSSDKQSIVDEIKNLLKEKNKMKEESFTDWSKRVIVENTGNPSATPTYITSQNNLWSFKGLPSSKQPYMANKDWTYHGNSKVLSYKGTIPVGSTNVSANPNKNPYGGIRLLDSNQTDELKTRTITLDQEVLNKTRGSEIYEEYSKLGYSAEDGNGINLSLKGIPKIKYPSTYVQSNIHNVKMEPTTGLPTPNIESDDVNVTNLFVKHDFDGNGDIVYDMGAINRQYGYGDNSWDDVDFSSYGYSSDDDEIGSSTNRDALIQTPLWVNNYPANKVHLQITGSFDDGDGGVKQSSLGNTIIRGINTHSTAKTFHPLAYIWLLSHGHRRTDSGYYFFHDYELSPANVFNFSPMSTEIPKGHLLMMGAILWRLAETGELVSEGIQPTGDGSDPVWLRMSAFKYDGNSYLDCQPWQVPFNYGGFGITTTAGGSGSNSSSTTAATAKPNAQNKNPRRISITTNLFYHEPKRHSKEFMMLPTGFKTQLIKYFNDWVDRTFPDMLKVIDPINFPDTSGWYPTANITGSLLLENNDWLTTTGPKPGKGSIGFARFAEFYTID